MTPLESLQRDGYVLIPSLLTHPSITTLLPTAEHAATLTRTGGWPHFRTVPKQFPPWPKNQPPPPASEGGIWGVQHLLHPEMPGRAEFAGVYFSDAVLTVVEELLLQPGQTRRDKGEGKNGEGEALVMELFNMLIAPETHDFELRWHRDDIPSTATPEEEAHLLSTKSPNGKQSHAQYNLALCPDSSLIVIPGSHRRVRTEVERSADPYEPYLPGQKVVELKPGDAVFYDSNIIHRGVYRAKAEGGKESRLTLHGSVGLKDAAGEGVGGDQVRATAVLQHGVGTWVHREDAAFGLGERAERMRRNLVDMGTGEGIGYSLQG